MIFSGVHTAFAFCSFSSDKTKGRKEVEQEVKASLIRHALRKALGTCRNGAQEDFFKGWEMHHLFQGARQDLEAYQVRS